MRFARNVMSPSYGLFLLLLQFFISHTLVAVPIHRSSNTNIVLRTPELVARHGYEVEVHKVITEDGYILEIHRLPCRRIDCESNFATAKRPVLIQHGLSGSSADWILLGPGRTLVYMLVDAGYDVWLGNNRGNVYSRNHTSMLPNERNFWNFSFHELGVYDLPATIDYILDRTNCDKLYYIGHSQGTTQFWVTMSQRPSYNAKVQLMISLAPAAYTGNIRGPITKLAKLTYIGVWIGESFGYPELRARSTWGKFVVNILCQDTTQFFCNNIMFLVAGFNQADLSAMNLTAIMTYVPAGASWKQLVHFGQGYIHPDHFRQFDYGSAEKNCQVYNSSEPPEYELNKVTAPVALFSSEHDVLADTKDVDLLKRKLGNVVFHERVSLKSFSHYDFIWGKSAVSTVFVPILKLLALYE